MAANIEVTIKADLSVTLGPIFAGKFLGAKGLLSHQPPAAERKSYFSDKAVVHLEFPGDHIYSDEGIIKYSINILNHPSPTVGKVSDWVRRSIKLRSRDIQSLRASFS